MNKENLNKKVVGREKAIGIGVSLGVVVGAVIGQLSGDVGLWISICIAIGAGIGGTTSDHKSGKPDNTSSE